MKLGRYQQQQEKSHESVDKPSIVHIITRKSGNKHAMNGIQTKCYFQSMSSLCEICSVLTVRHYARKIAFFI